MESRLSEAWRSRRRREESCQFLYCGPRGQAPTGHWQFPVVHHNTPPRPITTPRINSDSVCGWGGKKEESRSIRAGYLAGSCIRTKIRMNCSGKGMLHSGAGFILQLVQEVCVCVCFNRHISPFINHLFCRLTFSSLKYEKLRMDVNSRN